MRHLAWGGNGVEPNSAVHNVPVLQKPGEPVGGGAVCDMTRMPSLAVPLCGAPRRPLLRQPRPRDDLLLPPSRWSRLWIHRWVVQRGRMTPRHVLTFLEIVIGLTSPTQRLTRRCPSPQLQDHPGRHVPPALPVLLVLTHPLVRSLVLLLVQGPGPVPRPTAPLLWTTAPQAGRATRARSGRR